MVLRRDARRFANIYDVSDEAYIVSPSPNKRFLCPMPIAEIREFTPSNRH